MSGSELRSSCLQWVLCWWNHIPSLSFGFFFFKLSHVLKHFEPFCPSPQIFVTWQILDRPACQKPERAFVVFTQDDVWGDKSRTRSQEIGFWFVFISTQQQAEHSSLLGLQFLVPGIEELVFKLFLLSSPFFPISRLCRDLNGKSLSPGATKEESQQENLNILRTLPRSERKRRWSVLKIPLRFILQGNSLENLQKSVFEA